MQIGDEAFLDHHISEGYEVSSKCIDRTEGEEDLATYHAQIIQTFLSLFHAPQAAVVRAGWAALDALMESRSTVGIAHRRSTVVRADQIVVLHKGVAVERGTHAELSARRDSRYARYMQAQLIAPAPAEESS